MKTVAFVFFFVLFEIAMCLRCQHCQPSSCPPRPKCKGGYVKGLCNCCYTCAKIDGEKCGGIWNIHGKCDAGLICARDKARSKGVCVSSNTSFLSTQSKCTLPQETGPCKAMIRSWYYDSVAKTCKKFIYGGCKGNQNRFKGEMMCLLTCAVKD